MAAQTLEQLVDGVEKDLMFYIIASLRKNQITTEQAQELAKNYLSLAPFSGREDLFEKLHKLGETFPEAKSVYLKHAAPYEDEKAKNAVALMQQHLRNGEVEKAMEVAKQSL